MLDIPVSYSLPNNYDVTIGAGRVTFSDRTFLDFWSYNPIGMVSNSSQLPLVIISPGFRATGAIEPSTGAVSPFNNLATAYAMNGYRTVVLDHEDITGSTSPLINRAKEVNGVIDELTNPGQEVILVGHSLGAANALVMGMGNKSAYNPAISTIVAISPPTSDQSSYNLSSDDWSYLDVPSLFITGTNDTVTLDLNTFQPQFIPYQDRLDGALLAVEGNNFDIATTVINRATHFSFGNGAPASNQDIVISMSLAMSDRYNTYLASDDQIAADNFLRNANQLYSPTLATINYYQSQQLQSQSPNTSSENTARKLLDPLSEEYQSFQPLNSDFYSSTNAQSLTSSYNFVSNPLIDNQTFPETLTLKVSNDLTTVVEGEVPLSNPNTPDAWVYTDVNFSFDLQNQIGSLGLAELNVA